MAPSRNQPCPCGSGKKYKKCCLEKDEAAQRARLVEVLPPVTGDDDEDDDVGSIGSIDDWLADPAVQDALDDVPPLFEPDDITRVTYTRGFAPSVAEFRRGTNVEVTDWQAPQIPPAVLESFEIEALEELPMHMGHPASATPVQIEIIDIETESEHWTFHVFNRAAMLFRGNSAETRRIHRVCETLRQSAAGDRDVPVVSAERPARLRPRRRPQPGTCALCGAQVAAQEAVAHAETCAPGHDVMTGTAAKPALLVEVTSPEHPEYWLLIEARADAKFDAVDRFLRDIWLECCGHLSMVATDEATYFSSGYALGSAQSMPGMPPPRPERSMHVRLDRVLSVDADDVIYEYDFGSTTPLQLSVKSVRLGRIGQKPVRLVMRNDPIAWPCAVCGAPAEFVCSLCMSDRRARAAACARHATGAHTCGDSETFLPITNSPRNGICGYGAVIE
jgi:hypothetical protein